MGAEDSRQREQKYQCSKVGANLYVLGMETRAKQLKECELREEV